MQGYKIPGETIRLLDGTKRRSGEDVFITKKFKVESATSNAGEGFVCKVRSEDGTIIQATIMDAVMADHDKEIIQNAFWTKTDVILTISARRIGVDYKNAKIENARG
ncbi:hypothetical protein [Acetobacter fallax]|uniref:Uncharacterized protein n=1 Tax=Acetobacter fallax TaxID=1737473 RepID=A0ABX0KEZ6_9PROT|nr:hypothetical protein [Acetobacter fallax]NHO32507.1 hypothetical protein [Acetobacter fallax]NHO36067.1 hypothetical protein [Acetobacter fallax]